MSWHATRAALKAVAADRGRGARELGLEVARVVEAEARAAAGGGEVVSPEAREELARSIVQARPEMAPFYHLAAVVVRPPGGDLAGSVAALVRGFEDDAAARHTADRVPGSGVVVTYSRSGSVLEALRIAAESGKRPRVRLAEGRPAGEGRSAAAKLAAAGLEVELLTDAGLMSRIGDAELVLVGADAVGAERFRNKVGTGALALVAREAGLAFDVVADGTKLLPESLWRPAAERPADEVWGDPPPGVEVGNPYFEEIPLERVRAVVLGGEAIAPGAVADRVVGAAAQLQAVGALLDRG